jgi:hypothetical protein
MPRHGYEAEPIWMLRDARIVVTLPSPANGVQGNWQAAAAFIPIKPGGED